MKLIKKWLVAFGIALFGLPLLFWVLVKLVLPDVIRNQAHHFATQTGYQIEIGQIESAPFALRLKLQDLRLLTPEGDALLNLRQLEVDARLWPLLQGDVSLERLALTNPEILLARSSSAGAKDARWNWQRFVDAFNQAETTDSNQESKPSTMKISMDAVQIEGARLAVRDRQEKAVYELGPFSLHLTELNNLDAAGRVGGSALQSHYMVNLGKLVIPLPTLPGGPDRALQFDKVVADGRLTSDAEGTLKVNLDLALDEAQIKSTWVSNGSNDGSGALTGQVSLVDLAVMPWLSFAPSHERLEGKGVISGDFAIQQNANALTVDGDFKIDAFDVRVAGAERPLLGWSSNSFSQFHLLLPRDAFSPGLLTINDISMVDPRLRFVLNAQRISNFRSLFSQPESAVSTPQTAISENNEPLSLKQPAAAQPLAAETPRTAEPGFRYDIRNVRIKNGRMFFADESITPVFRVGVTELNGSLQGISNEPNRYASLILNGRAAKTGSLRMRGQLAFADPRQNNDVSLVFRNIPLNTTNPYTMTFAGYPIDDGRIDVDLRYVTQGGALEGKNRFMIKKIKLGEPVPDYQGTRLPLGLAIALLEDSDGMIDVNIPVKGNVNDPEFSVGHLVWQAVKTVLANVVTAPFRALGALLGIDHIEAIAFVPGESTLPLEGSEDLHKIAEFLAKRPKANLQIHGTYDPAVDSAELARAFADKAILDASGIKVVAGEPLPIPNLTDPKIKAGLNNAYASQVGRIKLTQRLVMLPDGAAKDRQLRDELIQSYKISDTQLKQLAAQRADAVKARLLEVDGKLLERITIGDAETVNAEDGGIPIRVNLETGH